MTLTELQQQYPGLFKQRGCQSETEAEGYADEVAGKAGLRVRKVCWIKEDGSRRIEYANASGTIEMRVEIRADHSGRTNTPAWLFSFSVERVDARLTAESEHRVLVNPSSFEREASDLIARLRRLTVKKGRVVGRLKDWNAAKGKGIIECVRGALVHLEASDLPSGSRIARNEKLSFVVEKSAMMRQKAVKVRTCCNR